MKILRTDEFSDRYGVTLGEGFLVAPGDNKLEWQIDKALAEKHPGFVSLVKTHKLTSIKYIAFAIPMDPPTIQVINTEETQVSFKDVWPEIDLLLTFS